MGYETHSAKPPRLSANVSMLICCAVQMHRCASMCTLSCTSAHCLLRRTHLCTGVYIRVLRSSRNPFFYRSCTRSLRGWKRSFPNCHHMNRRIFDCASIYYCTYTELYSTLYSIFVLNFVLVWTWNICELGIIFCYRAKQSTFIEALLSILAGANSPFFKRFHEVECLHPRAADSRSGNADGGCYAARRVGRLCSAAANAIRVGTRYSLLARLFRYSTPVTPIIRLIYLNDRPLYFIRFSQSTPSESLRVLSQVFSKVEADNRKMFSIRIYQLVCLSKYAKLNNLCWLSLSLQRWDEYNELVNFAGALPYPLLGIYISYTDCNLVFRPVRSI